MSKSYLRELGVFEVTVLDIIEKEWKGQKKIAFVLEDSRGRLIDWSLKYPFNTNHEFVLKQLKTFMSLHGAKKIHELKGKKAAVLVEPSEWKGKIYWNPSKIYDPAYLAGDKSPDELGLEEIENENSDSDLLGDDIRF